MERDEQLRLPGMEPETERLVVVEASAFGFEEGDLIEVRDIQPIVRDRRQSAFSSSRRRSLHRARTLDPP